MPTELLNFVLFQADVVKHMPDLTFDPDLHPEMAKAPFYVLRPFSKKWQRVPGMMLLHKMINAGLVGDGIRDMGGDVIEVHPGIVRAIVAHVKGSISIEEVHAQVRKCQFRVET